MKHNAHSSKILLKLLVVALMVIQTIIVAVGKNYYNRFAMLENIDDKVNQEIQKLTYEMRLNRERIKNLEEEMRIINSHLMEDAHRGPGKSQPLQTKRQGSN